MDLRHYTRVVRRFWYIGIAGLVAATALAFLSYRGQKTFQSTTTVFVTQSGFPWGRTAPSGPNVTPPGDVGRLASLAVFYSQFANGDVVQATLLQKLGFPAKVIVAPHPDASGNLGTVPFIDFIAVAPLAAESIQASKEAAAELRQYVIDQQASAGIAPADRVQLQVISTPRKALQLTGPSKTLPGLVFFVIAAAAFGVMLLIENLRPNLVIERPRELPMTSRAQDTA